MYHSGRALRAQANWLWHRVASPNYLYLSPNKLTIYTQLSNRLDESMLEFAKNIFQSDFGILIKMRIIIALATQLKSQFLVELH